MDASIPADPDRQNDNRAHWALKGVRAFQRATGITDTDGLDTAILDLLADLGHLCDRQNLELYHLIMRAAEH